MEGNCLKQVASLLVDMQNDSFVAAHHWKSPMPANTIAPHRALLQASRRRG